MMERDDALKFWDQVFNSDWGVDCFGVWMYKYDYGDTEKTRTRPGGDGKPYGWEIDHIRPKSDFKNESDANFLNNYEPMHWENNREKADSYPQFCIGKEKFKVVVCEICSKYGCKGYGIVNECGERVDWKWKIKNCFVIN